MVTKNTDLIKHEIKQIIKTLQLGHLSIVGQALRGSNSTFLTKIEDENISLHAIYKPSKGERPLWDFPNYTLAQREVSAFIVSYLLGWNLVPPTVFRSQPAVFGKGSLQLYVEHDPEKHYLNAPFVEPKLYMKIILFDLLINNADRKAGHVIFDTGNKPWLIDHGLCFNQEFKHRTVIWDFAGQQIPVELKEDIAKFINLIRSDKISMVKKLNMLLSEVEIQSMITRGKILLDQVIFPSPEPNRRSYPWPPI